MKLDKQLGFLDVFCICTGAMLSGLFILPGLAYAMAGPAVFISFFLAGLLALIGLLSQAELATAMPKAGGAYFYVTRSMGPMVGTIYGLTTWVSLALKSAYELLFISMFAVFFIHLNSYLMSIVFCLLLVLVNIRGVKEAGRVQIYLVFALLGVLLFYLVKGMPSINIMNFDSFLPHGTVSVISTAGFVFIAYGGLLKVASIAEEIKKRISKRQARTEITQDMVLKGLAQVAFSDLRNMFKEDGEIPSPSDSVNTSTPMLNPLSR